MKRKSLKTFLGILVIMIALMFAFGSCDLLFGPPAAGDTNGDTNGDDNGDNGDDIVYTPGAAIPPLSVIEGAIGFSIMTFDLIETDDVPPDVDIDRVEDGGVSTITLTFTNAALDQDDPDLKVNGEIVVVVTEATGTIVMNGEIAVAGHPEFENVVLFDATWIMPTDGGDDGPLSVQMAGSIAFDTVKYEMTDILRAVQAAYTVEGLVGNTIMNYVIEYVTWEGPGEWPGPDGVAVTGDEGGPYEITFTAYDPTEEGGFTISGSVAVEIDEEWGEYPLTFTFDGVVTADGFVFETIAMNTVAVTWLTEMDGPPDTVAGTMTFDGLTYSADYLTYIIMMFDDGNGNGG